MIILPTFECIFKSRFLVNLKTSSSFGHDEIHLLESF